MRVSIACSREELGAFSNRPSLSLERTADSCTIRLGFESHCGGNGPSRDTCQRLQGRSRCFIALAPLFVHPQGSPGQLFHVSASPQLPRARASCGSCCTEGQTPCEGAAAPLQLLGRLRAAPSLHFGAVTQHMAQLPASTGRLQLLEASCAPDLVLHAPKCPSGAGHPQGMARVLWAHAGGRRGCLGFAGQIP